MAEREREIYDNPQDTQSTTYVGVFLPIVLALTLGVTTGVLWAYLNPIPLVPGVIQWRIFAFLPPLAGILFGPRTGFITGYVGTCVWALLAGTFIPAHTLLVDGIMVGLTGLVPALLIRVRRPEDVTIPMMVRIGLICLVTGLVMVVAVSISLSFLGIFPFWYALVFLGLSDIVPMLVGTPLLTRVGMRLVNNLPRAVPRF